MQKPENPLFNISFNIIIPVLILNKGAQIFGPGKGVLVLLLALAFPVFYGAFDFIQNKRKNIVSAFGLLNVLFTGGLALYKLDGIWFAVKEAGFPLLIGFFVLLSAYYTKKSFFEYLIQHFPLKWDLIEQKITNLKDLKKLFKTYTVWLSFSFVLSAILNFILALYIFSEPGQKIISEQEKEVILNQQIARMTWMGFIVIGLPMTVFSIAIFWRFLKKLEKLTQEPMQNLFIDSKKNKA